MNSPTQREEGRTRAKGKPCRTPAFREPCVHMGVCFGVRKAAKTEKEHCWLCQFTPTFLPKRVRTTEHDGDGGRKRISSRKESSGGRPASGRPRD